MADYLIRARVIQQQRLLGRPRFSASVSAIALRSNDFSPASDLVEEVCESREAAREANERLIGTLSQELSRRGDRVLGVRVE